MQLVVGDKFASFACAAGALTRTAAVEALFAKSLSGTLAFGQGLSDQDRQIVSCLAEAQGLNVAPLADGRDRADRETTHKHVAANRMITTPRRIDAHTYEADLLIDDANEIMSDHLTGCHVQGMVLIEAIRQMFVAVGGMHEATKAVTTHGTVVFEGIDITFERFTFPLATLVRHTIAKVDGSRPDRVSYEACVEIEQNSHCCARAQLKYLVIDAEVLAPKEATKARLAVDACLEALEDGPPSFVSTATKAA